MTYCIGLNLDEGLLFASDSRTNAGVDDVRRFGKMRVFAVDGDRVIVTLSAGNLSLTQNTLNLLEYRANHGDGVGLYNAPGRLGPQGNPHRRNRNARPDGHPRGIRRQPAAQGRAHHRLAAHDHPDRRADRDAAGAGRRSALGLVQHLLSTQDHAAAAIAASGTPVFASRARRWRTTGTTPTASSTSAPRHEGEGPNMILDDGGDATLLMHLGKRAEKDALGAGQPQRRRAHPVRRHQGQAGQDPTWYSRKSARSSA
jgi:hypothetical protein